MRPSLSSLRERSDTSGCAQASPRPLAKLRLWIFHFSCRAYELGREGGRQRLEEGLGCQLAPKVLFRVGLTAKEGGGDRGTCAASEEPLRCPDVLLKLMHSSTGSTEGDGLMHEFMSCALQYLRAACAFLEASRQAEARGGDGGRHEKRELLNCPASNDDPDGGLPHSSFGGIEVAGRTEQFVSCQHSASSETALLLQPGSAPLYSSEDGASAFAGDHTRRLGLRGDECAVANMQEARMMLQFFMGTAFSCPSEPLAKAFQLIIARELEQSLRPFETCCGVLRFLSPLDTTPQTVHAERRRSEKMGHLYFLNGTLTSSSLMEALSSSTEAEDRQIQWFTSPSSASALPTLMLLLTGGLEELQQACDATAEPGTAVEGEKSLVADLAKSTPVSYLSRRRGGRPSKNRHFSSTLSEKELSTAEKGAAASASKQTVWDALCLCRLAIPYSVLTDRCDLLYRIFFKMGEVPRYYNVLSIYPDILRAHHATFQFIFFEEGPLPICERLMIALMTASRQKCEYLFSRFAALLLHFAEKQQSSEVVADTWLLQGPPPRLQALQRFIGIATHVPWQMMLNDIHGAMNAGWSIPGLIQASCIVAETLSLCSFVMGLFVPNDIWVSITLPPSLSAALSSISASGEVPHHQSHVEFTRYTGIDGIVSENRVKGSSNNAFTLSHGTFNWHEHGGTVMEQYYPGAATLINNELDAFSAVVRNLNRSDCVGLTTPEYSPSNAFWFLRLYVQNIMGFIPDDYPYNSINKVLRRPAKLIAQSCTMRPETLLGSQMRLWVQTAGDLATASGELPPVKEPIAEAAEKLQRPELDMTEQKQQLIESLTSHKAPFRLSMPGTETTPRPQPSEDVVEAAMRLHEERLMFLIVLATMEARKEGLLALLLYPLWELLNNM
ncbi:hypothetical protein TraAM80_08759 [Trypanosoma rangeli]|uniref:Uncharacterized protein n=1 Tax=Trypanosoma rangeli TaxID=5698 RepID=A0A422MZ31_TRYRA|nr:uncharacterized protein TraAM80_08759 [Trypanosoma rangeli]RNE98449.1 hypothetical protein TraAM80_08759 [Trypanosoma rangeli]|eukprot:RNE98449.1 hypothetical protein TraAM80_08759 [Trypanosoma rangeli]